MSNDTKILIDGVEIEVEKATRIINKLILRETKNMKTKQYNDTEMIKIIKKLIEEEAECY